MEIKIILRALRRRKVNLKKRICQENRKIGRLAHKSRSVRMASLASIAPRKNLYVDKLNELDLVIDLIQGKISSKDFSTFMVGDDVDNLLTAIGSL